MTLSTRQFRLTWTQQALLWVILPATAAGAGLAGFMVVHERHVLPEASEPLVRMVWMGASLLVGLLVATAISLRMRVADLERTHQLLAIEAKGKHDEHAQMRRMLDSLTVFVGLLTAEGRFIEANMAPMTAAGLKLEDVIGLRLEDTYWCSWDPEARARFGDAVERGGKGDTSRFDVEMRMAGQTRMLVDFVLVPLRDEAGGVMAMVISGVNITERESVRQAVVQRERETKRLIASVPGVVYEIARWPDGSRNFTFMSPRIEKLLGIPAERFMAEPSLFFDMIDRELREEYERCVAAAVADVSTIEFDLRFTLAGGEKLYLHLQSIPELTLSPDGSRRWTGVMVDITELKIAQQSLLANQKRFELAIGGTREGVWEVNYTGGKFYFSDKFKEMIGMAGQEIPAAGEFTQLFIHPDDHSHVGADVQAHLERNVPYDSEFRLKTPRGYRWFRSQGMAERDAEGRPIRFAGSIADIDDRRRMEQELRASVVEQRRLLGREHTLLRELNHRVRNNLTGLLGLVNLYQRSGRSTTELGLAIREKIFALRQVHDLIAQAAGLPVEISRLAASLADAVLPAEARAALVVEGPAVGVLASQSSALAMVLQELMTNSLKHGALREAGGGVRLTWSITDEHSAALSGIQRAASGELVIELEWQEWGMQGLVPPARRGTGLGLIEGMARSELMGDVVFAFEPSGMRCGLRISTPAADVTERGAARSAQGDMEDADLPRNPVAAPHGDEAISRRH